tara:strand:- start:4255 stop:4713 length:459 start_codon:yes stop_codon:yes gene_type:complete
MKNINEAIGLGFILGVIHGLLQPAYSVPVVPNFTQGTMTSTTETTSKVTETINSMDYNTGFQYTVTGSGIKDSGKIAPNLTESQSVKVGGVNSTWTGLNLSTKSRPSFTQIEQGNPFQFTETYSAPGLSNHTIIERETTVESITTTTSVFTQ